MSFQQYQIIPCKLLLGKRLSQCLNAALPAGVHIKALEVYDCIFGVLGQDKLPGNFFPLAFGLLPFFEYCATSTKANFLDIFERHILPIATHLSQSLPALVCSILPGLDENSSEFFERVFSILRRIDESFDRVTFAKALVAVFSSNSSQRGNVITYITQITQSENASFFDLETPVGQSLFLSFISNGVQDSSLIVIRGCMDVVTSIITFRPANSKTSAFQSRVVQILLLVLTRKDMSLSRRFLSWINIDGQDEFDTVSEAIKAIIKESKEDQTRFASLFKILTCILDSSKLSECILPDLIWELISLTREFDARNESFLKVANQFFELADLTLIWKSITQVQNSSSSFETLETLSFAIQKLKISEPSVISISILPIAVNICRKFSTYDDNIKIFVCRLLITIDEFIYRTDSTIGTFS